MTTLSQFDTPANISDINPLSPDGIALRRLWSNNISRWTSASILGDPWASQFDENRNFYFNPLLVDVPAGAATAAISWSAFPGRISEFYGTDFPADLLNMWADFGGVPGMPADVCPPGNSTPVANTPIGPRGWQD